MANTSWGQLVQQNKENAGGGGATVPFADYDAVVEDSEFSFASTGSKMWALKFQISTGPHAGAVQYTRIVLKADSPGSVKWFFKKCAALGLDDAFFAAEPSDDAVAEAMIGRPCVIQVRAQKKGDYKGEPEVAGILPPSGAAPVAAAPAPGVPPVGPATPAPAPVVPPVPAAPAAPTGPGF